MQLQLATGLQLLQRTFFLFFRVPPSFLCVWQHLSTTHLVLYLAVLDPHGFRCASTCDTPLLTDAWSAHTLCIEQTGNRFSALFCRSILQGTSVPIRGLRGGYRLLSVSSSISCFDSAIAFSHFRPIRDGFVSICQQCCRIVSIWTVSTVSAFTHSLGLPSFQHILTLVPRRPPRNQTFPRIQPLHLRRSGCEIILTLTVHCCLDLLLLDGGDIGHRQSF